MANLQFPENLTSEYKGKVQFKIAGSASTGVTPPSGPVSSELAGSPEFQEFTGSSEERSSTAATSRTVGGNGVTLYLPPGLQYNDGVIYENVDLGISGALIADNGGVFAGGVEGIKAAGGAIEQLVGDGPMSDELSRLIQVQAAKVNPGNLVGAQVREGIQAAAGVVANPNSRALFKRVSMREFSFTFKLIAKSRSESSTIESIVKFFRENLYPEEFALQGVGVGYKFPEKFDITISYDGSRGSWSPPKIKESYLKNVQTTYNSSGMSFHEDGKPFEVDLTLGFAEAAALNRQDIKAGS